MIGMRVQLKFGNPDPGYPVFVSVPGEPVTGTVIKQYKGVHERACYYVRLDCSLELTVTDPTPPFGEGHIRVVEGTSGNMLTAGTVRLSDVVGLCDDSFYGLARELVASGRGTASLASMILTPRLRDEFDLPRSQEEDRTPLTEREQVGLGYADIEVLN